MSISENLREEGDINSIMSTLIRWSCIQRNGLILAEAGCDDGSTHVMKTAQEIATMNPTSGWVTSRDSNHGWDSNISNSAPFRGIKFHLYEPLGELDDEQSDGLIIWAFCCVYNVNECTEEIAKAFLTKLLFVSEPLREMPWWREGGVLSAQPSFAPTLQQQMEQSNKLVFTQQHADETRTIIENNIEYILERGDHIEELQEEIQNLKAAAKIFKKNAKKVKRLKMLKNAKHGVVGVCAITPLIALI